ncbi:ComGF family competence protein [Enterococcus sp. MJM12]|uniref:ComGF family competence protein n=1 Tax=Candidatus Enterococcus myersii TaxID=2815322 RepID=A0ABS3H3D4_9ENTE|nr:competence type IV pilus minor pilin ComGF [Enterococcus sp. MJM12]MBO0447969.1 ComGF family competence protein [Enterococcus sp. MJM12]
MKIKAFTLLECLIALLIFNLCLLLITGLFLRTIRLKEHIMSREEQEFATFMFQLENELQNTSMISCTEAILKCKDQKGQTISIEKGQNMIRKKVDKLGHQPLLMDVYHLRFSKDLTTKSVTLKVFFQSGRVCYGKWVEN